MHDLPQTGTKSILITYLTTYMLLIDLTSINNEKEIFENKENI